MSVVEIGSVLWQHQCWARQTWLPGLKLLSIKFQVHECPLHRQAFGAGSSPGSALGRMCSLVYLGVSGK